MTDHDRPRRHGPLQQTLHRRHERLQVIGPIIPPAPGEAVLACRCGQVLALLEMHRPRDAGCRPPGSGPMIEPIRCRRCVAG